VTTGGEGGGPEPRWLTVGSGISLSGEVRACDRLVVRGSVAVVLVATRAIEVAAGGRFTDGRAEVEEAEVAGVYEGELSVRDRLLIRGTGRVRGRIRCGELEVERGGELSGEVAVVGRPEPSPEVPGDGPSPP
jgi:cytoskeletal protein CcmA (bactofilin family)